MGVVFLEHPGGTRFFCCASCRAPLTNRSELTSTRFTGATGRAYLFNKVVNVFHSGPACRIMLTGRHIVRDVYCRGCESKLGWMYEFATAEEQQYKEGKTILEKALIFERDGFVDENLESAQIQRQISPQFAQQFAARPSRQPQFGFGNLISDDE